MTAEEEQYYDSIDDSEFESCRSFCNTQFQDDDSDLEDNSKIEALVPFYNGNVDVDSIKNDSTSNSSTNLKGKLKRRNTKHLLPNYERRKNRSYLTMFYAKTGLQSKSGVPSESTRATCKEISPKICLSYDQDDKSSCCYFDHADDSERFYEKYMEEEQCKNANYTGGNQSVACMPCSMSPSDTKVYSVSEMQLNSSDASKKSSGIKLTKTRTRTRPLKVCELGGLGPNIAQEKLELLRKRQDYGKTVSQKNRLKFMENKVVQKLKDEIREGNKL